MFDKLKKFLKNPFFLAFILGIASLHIIRTFSIFRAKASNTPLVYVSDWQLTDHLGRTVGKKDFLGKLIVADYFFTSCTTICPMLTQAMKDVYENLGDKSDQIVFLSITVDPARDTPEVLKKFLEKNGINHKNWLALSGTPDEVRSVVVDNMRVHMGDEGKNAEHSIPHLAHLALFDQRGDLCGLFRTTPEELSSMLRAVDILLKN